MADGTNDLVGGFLLVLAFAHLTAATMERADWGRLWSAPGAVFFRGVVTLLIALRLTGESAFVRWLQDGTWVVGALVLLIGPAVLGCFAERWFAVGRLGGTTRGPNRRLRYAELRPQTR